MAETELEVSSGPIKKISLREILTLIGVAAAVVTYGETLRRDNVDLRQQVSDLRARVERQEAYNHSTYVRRDLIDEKLNAIIFRLGNVETYMRRITQ